jgi:hypothetical protein
MKLKHHIVASVLISGVLYSIFKSWGITMASLFTGIFIDLDHGIEYFIEFGKKFNIKNFFGYFYERQCRKAFLVFHGWEWFIILGAVVIMTNWNPFIIGILIGYGQHLALDNLFNNSQKWGYFLLWRWKNDFDYKKIFYPAGD